jgi:hypothetical protein
VDDDFEKENRDSRAEATATLRGDFSGIGSVRVEANRSGMG